jgi:hypothetical protein
MKIRLVAVLVFLAISFAVPASMAQDTMKVIKPDEIVWQEHPVFKGTQVCLAHGRSNQSRINRATLQTSPALQDFRPHSSLIPNS